MTFFIFILGLLIGSLLNAIIHRLHTEQSILERSSKCPHCGHELAWVDLVPLISFLVLRRKCRYCGKSISWQYPIVELATAIAFTLIYNQSSIIDFQLFFLLAFSCFLIVIFVYDLKHYLILDKVIIPGAILALIYQFWQGAVINALWGALSLSGFFGLLYLISKGRWIGLGDVKLGIFLGLLIPWPETLVLFLLSYGIGAVVSLGLIAWGSKTLTDKIPFGTFLTLAAFLAMLYGEDLIVWYFGLIY